MATQLAERRPAHPIEVFRQSLDQRSGELKMALPTHISVDKFRRVATSAVQANPSLLNGDKVDRASLFSALIRAAQDGLLPDGREGAIVPYKGKAQWMPMVAGIMKKVRNSGEIADWFTSAVYEKDEFEVLRGDDNRIYHKPYLDGDPGQVTGAYSIVTFKDGSKSRDFMPRWRIEKARACGNARDSLQWTTFYDEGAIKTVIRHHAKRLPQSTDVDAAFERDDFTRSDTRIDAPAETVAAEVTRPVSRLDALEHAISDEEGRPTSDIGDTHDGMADDLIGRFEAATVATNVRNAIAAFDQVKDAFTDDELERVQDARDAAAERLGVVL